MKIKLKKAYVLLFSAFSLSFCGTAYGEKTPALSERLKDIRVDIFKTEEELLSNWQKQERAKSRISRIRKILALHRKERELGQQRLSELQKYIEELEKRRKLLENKIAKEQKKIRMKMARLHASIFRGPNDVFPNFNDPQTEFPRRRILIKLIDQYLRQIEVVRVDLSDLERLEAQIQSEKDQLNYLFQDLKERESLLSFHQKLQHDILREQHDQRMQQWKNYRALKSTEKQVGNLIDQFNARVEFEKIREESRKNTRPNIKGAFAKNKGKLGLPVHGSIVSHYGKNFDPNSKLYVFRKGIRIQADKNKTVNAIFSGKVVYSGRLPRYGNVTIIDHGAKYYSLVAHLGDLRRKVGEFLKKGDDIGSVDPKGSPIYFEIRSRNVPVNPLDWLKQSKES